MLVSMKKPVLLASVEAERLSSANTIAYAPGVPPLGARGVSLSLGQKQLIAFMRAVLRHPDLLILDEATANIDTVTEQLLESILRKLPAHTTRVIIAHRLNTIENADEIFFVNGAEMTRASSMQDAVDMLLHRQQNS